MLNFKMDFYRNLFQSLDNNSALMRVEAKVRPHYRYGAQCLGRDAQLSLQSA